MKLFLNASEIAIITGDNKYQYLSDYIIKLYEKYFYEDSILIQSFINKKKEADQSIKITKSENAIECINRVSKEKKFNMNESLSKCLKSSNVEELKKNQETLKKEINQNNSISKIDKQLLESSIIQLSNTQFGTNHENPVIKYYETQIQQPIITTEQYFKKEFIKTDDFNWYIGGKVDGLFINTNNLKTVVEVKNRMKKLFYQLRNYEKVQMYIYMYLLESKECHLIECLKNNQDCDYNIIKVQYEADYFDKIKLKLKKFTKFFNKLLKNNSLKIKLYTEEKKVLEAFLKDLIFKS